MALGTDRLREIVVRGNGGRRGTQPLPNSFMTVGIGMEAGIQRSVMSGQSERRAHHRRPTSLKAQILLGVASPGLSCIVQDISAGGAGLSFAEPIELPPSFVLAIPNLDLMVAAQLRWSRRERHGVAFVWPQHQSVR
jgi:hypothetical protein